MLSGVRSCRILLPIGWGIGGLMLSGVRSCRILLPSDNTPPLSSSVNTLAGRSKSEPPAPSDLPDSVLAIDGGAADTVTI
ncbi:hypothetical protein BC835DRAFT_1396941, partial [Cytidiella melzeri]